MNRNMHVTLVGGFYRASPSAGGVRGYIESVGNYLEGVGIPHLTIVSGDTYELGDNWCSLPVRRRGSTAQMLCSLLVNLKAVPVPQDSIIHAQRPDELLPFLVARLGGSLVCTLHGNPRQGMMQTKHGMHRAAYVALEGALLRRTERVMFVDAGTAAQYRTRYPWLAGVSDIVPNAVDTSVFHPMDRAEEKRRWGFNGITFLYAGRLETEKRVVDIVKAYRQLGKENSELVIAGDGRERKMIEQEGVGLNLRLLGVVPRSKMPSLMNAADALVQFSAREGLPSTVLEALACGTPVIATPVGAIPDLIRNGDNGCLVASRADLVKAMNAVSTGKLAASGSIPKTIQQYSWLKIGPRLVQIYLRARENAGRRKKRG